MSVTSIFPSIEISNSEVLSVIGVLLLVLGASIMIHGIILRKKEKKDV